MPNKTAIKPLLFFTTLVVLMMAGCDEHKGYSSTVSLPKVTYFTVKPRPLSLLTELPGRTLAYRVADIRPQVSGIIMRRKFIEGSDVKAGESLYQIDPAPFKANVDRAAAQVQQTVADAHMAMVTLERYRSLLGRKYVSQQDYDQATATAAQAKAVTDLAQAALKNAQINLARTQVVSPINGRIGLSSVTEGALVQSEQSDSLATVQQLDPLYVNITQSADDYLHLQQQLTSGRLRQVNGKIPVNIMLSDGTQYPLTGSVAFSDVTVDKTTGAITLRAIVPNPQYQLFPGMFVRVIVNQGNEINALVIPQQAIVRTPHGDATVITLNRQNQVNIRNVEISSAPSNQFIVKQGLSSGDRVVIAGGQRISSGMTVVPIEHDAATLSETKG